MGLLVSQCCILYKHAAEDCTTFFGAMTTLSQFEAIFLLGI